MTINQFRRKLYLLAKVLGDVQAVRSPRKGAVSRRVARRIAGRITGRALARVFR